ncbi:MAG: IclR family transcriptional regulator [Kiritimatiellia bacterium]|jgi:DNA-binding IclR family transcriptional regulator|nr:IclR family transcriptional regulator [Kiritimatiellia bacterium]
MAAKRDARYSAPSLERGLAILECLARHPGGKGQLDLAQALACPVSSVFRLTLAMEKAGYLERDPDTKVFRLTLKMLTLGQQALSETDLVGSGMPEMRALRDQLEDTVLLGVLNGPEVIVLEQALGSHLFRFSVNAGHRIRAYCSAPGKAILAFLPKIQRERVIAQTEFIRFNANTITTPAAFRKELQRVAELGYAIDNGEEYDGIYCVGAPVFDRVGFPLAAVWVTGPAKRVEPRRIPQIGAEMKAGAERISRRLGWKG